MSHLGQSAWCIELARPRERGLKPERGAECAAAERNGAALNDVRSTNLTCMADLCEQASIRLGQVFDPRAGPAHCPRLGAAGALSKRKTERGMHQGRAGS